MIQNLVVSFGLAGILRLVLFSSNFAESIRNRIEVSTPLNSWKRRKLPFCSVFQHFFWEHWALTGISLISYRFSVKEGAFLYDNGIDPYAGDVYHESPIVLYFTSFLLRNAKTLIPYIFIGCDLLCAYLLYRMARIFIALNVSCLFFLNYPFIQSASYPNFPFFSSRSLSFCFFLFTSENNESVW